MKAFVIMGNDYPHSVYATKEAAEDFCEKQMEAQRAEQKARGESMFSPRIYWRAYEFEIIA